MAQSKPSATHPSNHSPLTKWRPRAGPLAIYTPPMFSKWGGGLCLPPTNPSYVFPHDFSCAGVVQQEFACPQMMQLCLELPLWCCKNVTMGTERWPHGSKHSLPSKRTQARFPVLTWWLTTSSHLWARPHLFRAQIYTQAHTYILNKINS